MIRTVYVSGAALANPLQQGGLVVRLDNLNDFYDQLGWSFFVNRYAYTYLDVYWNGPVSFLRP